ncbi:hypothetical protein [Thalassospira xiamenensis]|uniref:Uncharacterized protein n=1 Tax=Thalassospira xiamenensis TaxID=220697 RepID=A0A285TS36_9PROT|nr:hypothetical protein [Thalassospira xiamenensis]SOC26366.1 hypothetical protein SAMN05428964_105104 [Thalassospira xiamenensis]
MKIIEFAHPGAPITAGATFLNPFNVKKLLKGCERGPSASMVLTKRNLAISSIPCMDHWSLSVTSGLSLDEIDPFFASQPGIGALRGWLSENEVTIELWRPEDETHEDFNKGNGDVPAIDVKRLDEIIKYVTSHERVHAALRTKTPFVQVCVLCANGRKPWYYSSVQPFLSREPVEPMQADIDRLNQWLSITDDLPVECDGHARIVSALLSRENIDHTVFYGSLHFPDRPPVNLHYWIRLNEVAPRCIIDYRARMWLGEEGVSHGVFAPEPGRYMAKGELSEPYSPLIFEVLSGRKLEAFPTWAETCQNIAEENVQDVSDMPQPGRSLMP